MNGKNAEIAFLTNNQRYSVFMFGDMCIKFKTSPYLRHYDAILKWNNGYIECLASYTTKAEPIEEYIDLRDIASRLRLPADTFKRIKEVRIA